MKATIYGIQVEGTPKEIHEFMLYQNHYLKEKPNKFDDFKQFAQFLENELSKQHKLYGVKQI